MEGAASAMPVSRTTIDVPAAGRAPVRRRSGEHRTPDLRKSELHLELLTFPLADFAPADIASADLAPAADAVLDVERPVEAVIEDVQPRERDERLCRAVNVTIAAIALIALSPIFLLVALAVKLTS